MTAEIIDLPVVTTLDMPAEKVLQQAIKADLDHVVIVAYDKEGGFYFSSNKSDGGDALWLLEGAKAKLIKIGFFKE